MHLIITENQKHLIRFQNYSTTGKIEVFSLNPIQAVFSCEGRILGFSLNSSLMLIWNESYFAYDLARGSRVSLNREDYAHDVLLDVRGTGYGMKMQIFDVISDRVVREVTVPEEKGVSKGFEAAIKIIGTGYGIMDVWYDTTWGEGNEGHVYELATGKYQFMTHLGIDHYQPKQKVLYNRKGNSIWLTELATGTEITSRYLWGHVDYQFWKVSAIASFPDKAHLLAVAKERDIYFFDVLTPEPPHDIRTPTFGAIVESKMTAWHKISALCIDASGRYLYISYKNGEIDVFDMELRHFSEHYRIPLWKKLFG